MEEFRSTEILDKEIQEDARRKAERLIKRAETDGQVLLDENQAKIEKTAAEKKALYAKKLESYKTDLAAALPLEKERFLVSFEDSAVNTAIDNYIASLNEAKKIELLAKFSQGFKSALAGKNFSVLYHGFSETAIKDLVKKEFADSKVSKYEQISETVARDTNICNGMLIETDDRFIRCRITITELISSLLDSSRFELANTLFDGRLTQ